MQIGVISLAAEDLVTEKWCGLRSGTIKDAIENHNMQMAAYMERIEQKVNRHEVAIIQMQQREKNEKEYDVRQDRTGGKYIALAGAISAVAALLFSNIDKLVKLFN